MHGYQFHESIQVFRQTYTLFISVLLKICVLQMYFAVGYQASMASNHSKLKPKCILL